MCSFRKAISLALFCLLMVESGIGNAAENQPPLAPGKPAGVKKAQRNIENVVFYGVLTVLVVGGIYVASRPYLTPGEANAAATAAPTSTSP